MSSSSAQGQLGSRCRPDQRLLGGWAALAATRLAARTPTSAGMERRLSTASPTRSQVSERGPARVAVGVVVSERCFSRKLSISLLTDDRDRGSSQHCLLDLFGL